ncbi:MAG: class I SAM-dependent methyltransferase [Terriglobus roseus]|nr:class I SAM-dependent methyltransferase [Terriglobus roseus]
MSPAAGTSSTMSLLSPITDRARALGSYAGSFAWPPLVNSTRHLCIGLLKNIRIGRLEIEDYDGRAEVCGTAVTADVPHTLLRVHNDTFWIRLALFADMGFAESYMLGEVSCSDLTAFFKLFILNRPYLANGSTLTSALAAKLVSLLRATTTNSLSNARLNIAAHYDISNDMFAAFLSPDMTYSCAIWSLAHPQNLSESLEEAQHRKLKRFIDNTKIKKEDHVLEIGTGWGSFAIKAVRETGCRVTSLTLSMEQKVLAEERIKDAGLDDRITVLLCDYRKAPLLEGGRPYDKVVSIEMLEAVGREWLTTYFACVDRLLKQDGGIAAFQCITIPETVSLHIDRED